MSSPHTHIYSFPSYYPSSHTVHARNLSAIIYLFPLPSHPTTCDPFIHFLVLSLFSLPLFLPLHMLNSLIYTPMHPSTPPPLPPPTHPPTHPSVQPSSFHSFFICRAHNIPEFFINTPTCPHTYPLFSIMNRSLFHLPFHPSSTSLSSHLPS